MSGRVTLLVHGDLASENVTDVRRQYSQKLVIADKLRRAGSAIVVIDGQGFADLLKGYPARNRQLRAVEPEKFAVIAPFDEGILGGPLATRRVSEHQPLELVVDLAELDKGTAAHESTVSALAAVLEARGVKPQSPSRLSPKFDVGWSEGGVIYVAEVKSLGGADESQQIRLGLGQILDYAQQIRESRAGALQVQPVLVLERGPESSRWAATATSAGVKLTWGPEFKL